MSLDPTKQYFTKYTNEKLGSYFIGENSGKTVTEIISQKADTSAVTETIETVTSGKTDDSAFSAHTASTVHMSTTEKTNLDSLATNIAAISGITSTKVSNWDGAATNSHSHSNKAALDAITGSVGSMAYENKTSYSSATQVNTALAGKSDTGHTHDSLYQAKGNYLTGTTNYAGASTQGGAATSAAKLTNTTAVGSVTQPVFFTANGVPSACTYTLGKSVPSDAVFTDNNTTYAAGSFVTITGTNNSINVSTGTSSSTVARGDHSHDYSGIYQAKNTALDGITTAKTTSWDDAATKAPSYTYSAITSNINSFTSPIASGATNNGKQAHVLFYNSGSSEVTITIPTTYHTPSGAAETIKVKAGGFAEVNCLVLDGKIWVRGA